MTRHDLTKVSEGLAVGKVGPTEKNGESFALFLLQRQDKTKQ